MTIGPDPAGAVTAFNRFGFGVRPGDLSAAAGDPRGFLLEELWTSNIALIRDRAPPPGPAALQAYYLEQQQIRTERMKLAQAPPAAAEKPMTAAGPAALSMTPPPGRTDARGRRGRRPPACGADGPRIAALAFDGFDTHQNEGAAQGLLAQRLQGLDAAFDAFETDLGDAWKDTVVVAITEFGRTVRVNGTHGTDHGTATVALLAGGALAGGRVIADWPTLKAERLYEGRDLYPTDRPARPAQGPVGRPVRAYAEDARARSFSPTAQA